MIIDNHVHIGDSEKTRRAFTLQQYFKFMVQVGIDYSLVMPNVSSITKSSVLNKEFIINYKKSKLKKFFYPLILIDPKDKNTLLQMREYNDLIYGVKYHPSVSETPLTDESLYPFMEVISEYKFPVLVHCGRHWRSNISYVIKSARIFRSIVFVAAHLGGNASELIEKAIDALYETRCDNIYLDTSAVKLPWLIEKAIKMLGEDKIIFGSDEPYSDLRIGKYCIELCNISKKINDKIFYKNVRSLYNVYPNVGAQSN
ncbi:MAG: amidohydrolase family protein [Candidatus Thorarchaeota archaeon]|jgi:predicted TIM-barrel fold metal-dependent hydrolase